MWVKKWSIIKSTFFILWCIIWFLRFDWLVFDRLVLDMSGDMYVNSATWIQLRETHGDIRRWSSVLELEGRVRETVHEVEWIVVHLNYLIGVVTLWSTLLGTIYYALRLVGSGRESFVLVCSLVVPHWWKDED